MEYVQGDLRELPFDGRFDAVLNWFTSFGYFDDEGNRRVLEGFHRALRPGGTLLLEQASRGFSLAQPTVEQLAGMLRGAGFAQVEALNELGERFTLASRRLVVRARRD